MEKPPEDVTGTYQVGEVDSNILSLFPSLNFANPTVTSRMRDGMKRILSALLAIAEGKNSKQQIVESCQVPSSTATRSIKLLEVKGLVCRKQGQTRREYYPTAKGLMALMAFPKFRKFDLLRTILTGKEYMGDVLAFALLTAGLSLKQRNGALYETLLEYAKDGRNLEDLDNKTAADSILRFLSNKWRYEKQTVPEYLNVLREFTTQGFEVIIRTILAGMKPKPEDYNSFIQFLCEVADFYYNPIRRAYANLLGESPDAKQRLEQFKREREGLVRQEGSSSEVTFRIRDSSEFYRFSNMPAHLQAIGLRLIVEPLDFMIRELKNLYWPA